MKVSIFYFDRIARRGFGPAVFALELALALALADPLAGQVPAPPSPEPIQIFFPPVPPPFDAPHLSAIGAPREKYPAPTALAAFVDEPFYAPLSTRYAKSEIGDDLDFRLATYKARQNSLVTELRARIHTLREADPAARVQALEEFANEQNPGIDALEKEADLLRGDLSEHGSGYTECQRWRSSLSTSPNNALTPALQLEIIRMAVFYRDGLSPAQRRLLNGIAVERADHLNPPKLAPGESAGSILYFLPETARIAIPANLPTDVADKIDRFRQERTRLGQELLEALFGRNVPASEPGRRAVLLALAKTQDPRLAALEDAAEDIRRSLALVNDPGRRPELPDLPVDLAARIKTHRAEDVALNKAMLARREEVMKNNPGADNAVLEDKISQALAAFSAENAARFAALDQSADAIRADLAKLPGATDSSTNALLMKNSESLRRLNTAWDYRDYQIAVLQPGLSPQQRRLLFASAVQKFALPLPGGGMQADPP